MSIIIEKPAVPIISEDKTTALSEEIAEEVCMKDSAMSEHTSRVAEVQQHISPKVESVPSSSSSLLYSEYMKTDNTQYVVKLIEKKSKKKPRMKFVRSSVLLRVQKLLPRLEESLKDIEKKPKRKCNIEVVEENAPAIEMNVALVKQESSNSGDNFSLGCDSSVSESTEEGNLCLDFAANENLVAKISGEKPMSSNFTERKTDFLDILSNVGQSPKTLKSCTNNIFNVDTPDAEFDSHPSKKLCQMLE